MAVYVAVKRSSSLSSTSITAIVIIHEYRRLDNNHYHSIVAGSRRPAQRAFELENEFKYSIWDEKVKSFPSWCCHGA